MTPELRRGRGMPAAADRAAAASRLGYARPMKQPEKTVPFGAADVAADDKSRLVRGVFDTVAPRYDLMNDLMSVGVHRLWKQALVDRLNPQPGELVVDVATGTGDVARLALSRAAAKAVRSGKVPARAICCDINESMLRSGQRQDGEAALLCADAEKLPIAEGVADAVTIAFGIRNVTHIPDALSEMRRVLKFGGRFLCLEFSHVAVPGFDRLYSVYSDAIIPRLGAIFAGNASAYRYLVESIRRFPDQMRFAALLEEAGFGGVGYRNLSGGIAALHWGWRL